MARPVTKFNGADKTIEQVRRMKINASPEFARAAYQEYSLEVVEIQQVTPVETGALRATIHVTEPVIEDGLIRMAVVAGGPSAPYAFIVHEDTEAFHEEGEAKYIERPMRASAPFMASRIAKRVDMNKVVNG